MSKANAGHIMPENIHAISRLSMLHAGALLAIGTSGAVSSSAVLAFGEEPEWPEFREWYALMLEEEALCRPGNTVGESGTEDDSRNEVIVDRMCELRSAMQARPATAPVHEAVLAVLALHAADRGIECVDTTGQFRFLTLGAWNSIGNGFEVRVGMMLIEKNVRQAVLQNLLPGVAIYGEGGNA